jgi:hypothetical protein
MPALGDMQTYVPARRRWCHAGPGGTAPAAAAAAGPATLGHGIFDQIDAQTTGLAAAREDDYAGVSGPRIYKKITGPAAPRRGGAGDVGARRFRPDILRAGGAPRSMETCCHRRPHPRHEWRWDAPLAPWRKGGWLATKEGDRFRPRPWRSPASGNQLCDSPGKSGGTRLCRCPCGGNHCGPTTATFSATRKVKCRRHRQQSPRCYVGPASRKPRDELSGRSLR